MKIKTIGDYFDIKGGKRLPKGSSFYPGKSPFPYIRVTDFKRNGLKLEGIKYIDSEVQSKIKRYTIEAGSVYISIAGTIGIVGIIPDEFNGANLTENAAKLVPKKGVQVHNRFISYLLNSDDVQNIIESKTMAVGVPKLALFRIQEIPIILPPLPTQKKIAAILDAADAYRQKTKTLIDKYDQLAQSLFLEMFGDPVRNEKEWALERLDKVTSKIGSGATPSGGRESYHNEGVSLIRSMNVYDNEFKYKDLAFLNEDQAEKLKNVTVEENDVLFNITGASVCRCCIVPPNILPARVNQHVSILRSQIKILSPIFLNRLLVSKNCKKQLLGIGTQGGATREAITKEQLEKFEIIFPPITLQNQFAERIQLIESQNQQAQSSLQKAEDLFNSLLQQAFKGELVE